MTQEIKGRVVEIVRDSGGNRALAYYKMYDLINENQIGLKETLLYEKELNDEIREYRFHQLLSNLQNNMEQIVAQLSSKNEEYFEQDYRFSLLYTYGYNNYYQLFDESLERAKTLYAFPKY